MASAISSGRTGTSSDTEHTDGAADEIRLTSFVAIAAQLGLLALVLRQFQIQNSAFLRVALLAFAGFAVQYFLPKRLRLPFFGLLSIAGTGMVLGVSSTLWLVGIGGSLIVVCHLPVAPRLRVALLILLAMGLAILRGSDMELPWSQAMWPVLGSMFMFRLLTYFYDSHHGNAPTSFWHAVAYFFMLPNVVFPLFPVVDYQRFTQDYENEDRHRIYQVGIQWMIRGVTHLLLYRIVYYYYAIGPEDVTNLANLAQFIVTNFLLYLRISGQFHLVVGMLHLFGFNLSETNHLYSLSSSFNEFWRRINIYWKDFMMKLFYYPIYFRLRKVGPKKAIVLSTIIVFTVTWFLHSYQWFWLRGNFPVVWQDGVYWSAFGLIIVANSLYEMSHRKKKKSEGQPVILRVAGNGLSIVATFSVVCVLWSLWTCDSLADWLALWPSALNWDGVHGLEVFGVLAGSVFVFGVLGTNLPSMSQWTGPLEKPAVVAWSTLTVLALVGLPQIHTRFQPETATFVSSLRSGHLNPRDAARLERSYYDELLDVGRFNDELSKLYASRPVRWLDVQGSGLKRFTGDFMEFHLMPSFTADTIHGEINTNRWGMRDKDYEKKRPEGTFRIALLGASLVMGWGVEDDEGFEALLEERLNASVAGGTYDNYEILNFAAPGFMPPQEAPLLDKALEFEPNLVVYVATGREFSRAVNYMVSIVEKEVEIPYEPLRSLVEEARTEAEESGQPVQKMLSSRRTEIIRWLYDYIASESRKHDAVPVWLFLPQLEDGTWQEETAPALELAKASGFKLVDFSRVYDGYRIEDIRVSEYDMHPNARAHKLIADRLHEEFSVWSNTENAAGQ